MVICTAALENEFNNIFEIVARVSVLNVMTRNLLKEPQVAVGHMLHGGRPRSAVNHEPPDRWCMASPCCRMARLK